MIDPQSLRAQPEELRTRYIDEGWWDDRTLGSMLHGWLTDNPGLELRVWSAKRPQVSSFGRVAETARRLAAALGKLGIGMGDVVCMYVPNSLEGAVGFVGVPLVGAAILPVAPYYGMRELEFILKHSGARVLVTAEGPHGDRLEAIAAMRAELPALEHVFVLGDAVPGGMRPISELLQGEPLQDLPAVDPDDVAVIAFTSGTTSVPKGVVHTHRSICCEVWLHMDRMPRASRPQLVGGPIAHVTGMLAGLFLPPLRGHSVHLIDGWDPAVVLTAMRECGLSAGSGAPVFLDSLIAYPDTRPEDLAMIECVGLGGASIPVPFVRRLDSLGIYSRQAYGATEHPSISAGTLNDTDEQRQRTVGCALPGVEIRIVGEDGGDLPVGAEGEIITRGPDLCAGYIDPAMNAESFDADGWFSTGDIGVLDDDGFLRITDRRKDIIIRNGVNVSAVEVENALLEMPELAEVAVVAAPDPRTGERGHAFLRLKPGAEAPDLQRIRAHLDQLGMAKQKYPESLELIDEFPRTPAGKIRKVELRERVRQRASS